MTNASGGHLPNALSFDVEDWRQIVRWKLTGEIVPPTEAVLKETHRILDIVGAAGIRATFFILGNVARTFPQLVQDIDAAGHEVGSHGLSHKLIYRQDIHEFRTETREAKNRLEDTLGKPVLGYRAAEFSITRDSWWALDVLAELGFRYDSSIYPIAGRRYGVPDAPVAPHRVQTETGLGLWEMPLTVVRRWGRNWPVAGGGYFRFAPYSWTANALREVNSRGRAGIVYLHPYEFAQERIAISVGRLSLPRRLRYLRYTTVHNFGRERLSARFGRLLQEFTFAPVCEVLQSSEEYSSKLEAAW